MLSELVACDGRTLLPKWWPQSTVAKADPQGWRMIMVAADAHTTRLCIKSSSLRPHNHCRSKLAQWFASESMGEIRIGLCTAIAEEGALLSYSNLTKRTAVWYAKHTKQAPMVGD
jgi:hypothetical protein